MVSRILKLALGLGLLAAPLWVMADNPPPPAAAPAAPPPPPPPLVVKAQVGYVSSHGNTDAQTANAKLEVTLNSQMWKHDLQLSGLYGKSDNIVSAEMFQGQWQSNYNFTDRAFAFGALNYDDDKFSGFQYQETVSTGLGYSVVKLKNATLDVQLGVGYRRLRPELIDKDAAGDVTARIPLDAESGTVATATVNGMYQFNSSTKATEVVHLESGSDNTLLQNDLGLQVSMSKSLSITIAYEVKHNSSPPAGLVKTDSLVTLNLTYAFPTPP
jgi:putative salt-induced outer membrane protein